MDLHSHHRKRKRPNNGNYQYSLDVLMAGNGGDAETLFFSVHKASSNRCSGIPARDDESTLPPTPLASYALNGLGDLTSRLAADQRFKLGTVKAVLISSSSNHNTQQLWGLPALWLALKTAGAEQVAIVCDSESCCNRAERLHRLLVNTSNNSTAKVNLCQVPAVAYDGKDTKATEIASMKSTTTTTTTGYQKNRQSNASTTWWQVYQDDFITVFAWAVEEDGDQASTSTSSSTKSSATRNVIYLIVTMIDASNTNSNEFDDDNHDRCRRKCLLVLPAGVDELPTLAFQNLPPMVAVTTTSEHHHHNNTEEEEDVDSSSEDDEDDDDSSEAEATNKSSSNRSSSSSSSVRSEAHKGVITWTCSLQHKQQHLSAHNMYITAASSSSLQLQQLDVSDGKDDNDYLLLSRAARQARAWHSVMPEYFTWLPCSNTVASRVDTEENIGAGSARMHITVGRAEATVASGYDNDRGKNHDSNQEIVVDASTPRHELKVLKTGDSVWLESGERWSRVAPRHSSAPSSSERRNWPLSVLPFLNNRNKFQVSVAAPLGTGYNDKHIDNDDDSNEIELSDSDSDAACEKVGLKTNIDDADEVPLLELHVLGTGCAAPSPYRGASGYVLRWNLPADDNVSNDTSAATRSRYDRLSMDLTVIVEAGEGFCTQWYRHVSTSMATIRLIWVSHAHWDHYGGLAPLLYQIHREHANSISPQSAAPKDSSTIPRVVAPRKVLHYLDIVFGSTSRDYFSGILQEDRRSASQAFHELKLSNGQCPIAYWENIQVNHSCPAFGFVAGLHVFPQTWRQPPFVFCFSGDTSPCSRLIQSCRRIAPLGIDLLLHEATFGDDEHEMSARKKHSTVSQAIGVMKSVRAWRLLLSHFSQRYDNPCSILNGSSESSEAIGCAFDGMRVPLI